MLLAEFTGLLVGRFDGKADGDLVERTLGEDDFVVEGTDVGVHVGNGVGAIMGRIEGANDGVLLEGDGALEGAGVAGAILGRKEGDLEGAGLIGALLGLKEGDLEGEDVIGALLGRKEGDLEGTTLGEILGTVDGTRELGLAVSTLLGK